MPINASVNAGLMSLVVKGSFDNVQLSMVKVIVKFPLFHHNQYACKVKRIQNDRYALQSHVLLTSVLRPSVV